LTQVNRGAAELGAVTAVAAGNRRQRPRSHRQI